MRIILLIIFCGFLLKPASGQDIDSLKAKIAKMDIAINSIHLNMVQSHKEFKLGTFALMAGTATSIVGALMIRDKGGDLPDNHKSPALLYIGGGLMTIGTIIQIDSHKWIGRGGRKRR